MIKLTARQIDWLSEINNDKKATDETLRTAMEFHSNRMNELAVEKSAWWDDLREIHGLDLDNKTYRTVQELNAVYIVEDTNKGANEENILWHL